MRALFFARSPACPAYLHLSCHQVHVALVMQQRAQGSVNRRESRAASVTRPCLAAMAAAVQFTKVAGRAPLPQLERWRICPRDWRKNVLHGSEDARAVRLQLGPVAVVQAQEARSPQCVPWGVQGHTQAHASCVERQEVRAVAPYDGHVVLVSQAQQALHVELRGVVGAGGRPWSGGCFIKHVGNGGGCSVAGNPCHLRRDSWACLRE